MVFGSVGVDWTIEAFHLQRIKISRPSNDWSTLLLTEVETPPPSAALDFDGFCKAPQVFWNSVGGDQSPEKQITPSITV